MNIPTWQQCEESVKKGTATPLEVFIYDNEPLGIEEEKRFRDQLQSLIKHVFTLGELSSFDRMD